MYPNKYFNLRQWAADPDDSWFGRSRYQYGNAIRSIAMIRTPAAAAFSAVAPFDFFEIQDPSSGNWRFTFRPDVAPGPAIIVNRTVEVSIQGQTAIQVAQSLGIAITDVSAAQNIGAPGARLQVAAQLHSSPNDDQLTLTSLLVGPSRPFIDTTGITGVAGFVFTQFPPAKGGFAAGSITAVGFILCVPGASLIDGELVTIESPLSSSTTITVSFEFDSGGAVAPGNTAVPFTGGDSAATIAATLLAAINNPAADPVGRGPLWGTVASILPGTGGAGIQLISRFGSNGGSIFSGQLMTETVANAGFIVAGLTGGQDGSILVPLRWGLSRGMIPQSFGFDVESGEG